MFSKEQHKYLAPKFSYAMKDMAQYFDVFEWQANLSTLSKTSSNMSFRSTSLIEGLNESAGTPRNKIDLHPVKESLMKKDVSRNRYRHTSVKNTSYRRTKRHGSSSLPPVKSSRSRSGSKKKKLKFKGGRGKGSTLKRVKARVLKHAVSFLWHYCLLHFMFWLWVCSWTGEDWGSNLIYKVLDQFHSKLLKPSCNVPLIETWICQIL